MQEKKKNLPNCYCVQKNAGVVCLPRFACLLLSGTYPVPDQLCGLAVRSIMNLLS